LPPLRSGGGAWLRALAALVGCLPWRALRFPAAFVGWLAGSVLRVRRAHVEQAMRAAGVASPSRQARAMYAALGRSALEFLWLSRRGAEALAHVQVDPSSEPLWRTALAGGRGVVLAASHTGNWDLAAIAAARDTELLVVTKRLSAPSLDRFWQSARARLGVRLCDAPGAMAEARSVVRRGGAVAMMIDQVPAEARHAVAVPFLGRRALADRAPAAVAASTGAPLVVVAARAAGGGRQVLHVLAVLAPPPRPGPTWIAEATRASSEALEAFVRAHPSQWLWMHRRWKERGERAEAGVDPGERTARLGPPWSKPTPPSRSGTRSSSPDAASTAG
jgi:KDO2-lipid IV(A) lauroyltransferase